MTWRAQVRAHFADSPPLALLFCICAISEQVSAGYWLARLLSRRLDTNFYGWYVIGWLAGLVVALAFGPSAGNWALVIACLALYRLQDMVFGTITDAFRFREFTGSWQGRVVLAILNIIQVVTIFAIVFGVFAPGRAFAPVPPHGPVGRLYLSWSSMPPLGSGFTGLTTAARGLSMLESAVGALLILIALSRFLANPENEPQRRAAEAPGAGRGKRASTVPSATGGPDVTEVAVAAELTGPTELSQTGGAGETGAPT